VKKKSVVIALDFLLTFTLFLIIVLTFLVASFNFFTKQWNFIIKKETIFTMQEYSMTFITQSLLPYSGVNIQLPYLLRNSEVDQVPRTEFYYEENGNRLTITGLKTNILLILLDEVLSRKMGSDERIQIYLITPMEISKVSDKEKNQNYYIISISPTIFNYE
jgi:hypothetical protein